MTTDTNLLQIALSFGGVIFFILIFVFALFGSEIIGATRRAIKWLKKSRGYPLPPKDENDSCPL